MSARKKRKIIIERAITTQRYEYMGECVFVWNRAYWMAMRIDNYLIKFNFISIIICAVEGHPHTTRCLAHRVLKSLPILPGKIEL